MGRDGYLDDCVLSSEREGQDPLSLDEEETHESELSGSSADYGSLLGLGRSIRKKQPCIAIDPEEAENAARLVQHAGAHQLSGDDGPPIAAFVDLPGVPEFHQPEDEAQTVDPVEPHDPESDWDEPDSWDFIEPEEDANPAGEDDVAGETPSLPSHLPGEWPMPFDEPTIADPDPVAAVEEAEPPVLPVRDYSAPAPSRHSLRRSMPAPQSVTTPTQRFALLARRVWQWLASL
jgi:hypothetical protein